MIDVSQFQDERSQKSMEEFRAKEAEQLAQILSNRYGIPYIDLGLILLDSAIVKMIPESLAREAKALVFQVEGHVARVAILTPNNDRVAAVTEELNRQGFTAELYLTSEYALERAWQIYHEVSYAKAETAGVMSVSDTTMQKYISEIKGIKDVRALIDSALGSSDSHSNSTVVEILMGGAVATGVSDVHLEPEKDRVRFRYRLDGVLRDVAEVTPANYRKVLGRIKLLSGVKLNVTKEAQDGRFTIKIQGVDVEVRVSILPSAYAEAVVMRILNPKSISVPMEELGMDEHLYAIMDEMIHKPNGLILTTGPTGSGKTTTLYAILKKLRSPDVKIITIEDPIEYHLDGISQTQVDHEKGYDFHSGLRAAVRQDPDIIMVGEIRDNETASVAIDSALTGHLVFSTLHTNNAAGTIPRLIDIGVNPKIIGSALNIALAQRLVRKLCLNCREEYVPEGREKEFLENIFPSILKLRPTLSVPERLYRARARGCEKCTETGYKGRISIYEGIRMDSAVEEVIKDGNPSEREIRAAAMHQGILDMRQDGVVKVLKGITSISEVEEAVGLTDARG
jgi:type IV pilus assembly protein PilB